MPRRLNVLILEDRPADAELVIDRLKQAGFDVRWERVETEEQYLARLRPDLDVILADYALPRYDALEALQQLRQRDLDTPFIIVSGTVTGEAASAALRAGADDYLLKDRLTRLGPAVEQALEARRLRDERRSAEREARLSADQWEATFNAIEDPIAVLDAGARIVHCNQAMETFVAEPRNQLIGRSCCEVVHGQPLSLHDCPSQRAFRTRKRETALWRRDGRWFRASAHPWMARENHLIGFVYILEDVTEHREAQAELREKVAQLERINRLFVDRERRMLQLKREVNALLGRLGQPPRYASPGQADALRSGSRSPEPTSVAGAMRRERED